MAASCEREGFLPIDWTEEMSVGVESIDVHHRQVWRRIRHLANAVGDGRSDEVRAALRFLHGYLAEHHADEERWMSEAGYPGSIEHARAHQEILGRVAAAAEREALLDKKALLLAADWVARAIEEHMRTEDLKLGRFWTARENLRRLAETAPGVGASLTPLPGSVPSARTPAPGSVRSPARGLAESSREDEARSRRR